ncbi:hypothetical protein ACIBTV_30575 [Micromonospora sp. NPDC049366]|uniref:hypothetical protein n=1 Tax=Micromonospora sp. NPDC049366 TaxID=3364271 RepID=UPI00379FBB6D
MLRILVSGHIPAGIDSGDHERWWIDSPQALQQHGPTLRDLLSQKITEFEQLLDREAFKQRLSNGAPLPGDGSREAALAVLLADEGPSVELDNVLGRLHDPGSTFTRWANMHAAGQRDGAGGHPSRTEAGSS